MLTVADDFAGVVYYDREFFDFMFGFYLLPDADSHIQNDYDRGYGVHSRTCDKQ